MFREACAELKNLDRGLSLCLRAMSNRNFINPKSLKVKVFLNAFFHDLLLWEVM